MPSPSHAYCVITLSHILSYIHYTLRNILSYSYICIFLHILSHIFCHTPTHSHTVMYSHTCPYCLKITHILILSNSLSNTVTHCVILYTYIHTNSHIFSVIPMLNVRYSHTCCLILSPWSQMLPQTKGGKKQAWLAQALNQRDAISSNSVANIYPSAVLPGSIERDQ